MKRMKTKKPMMILDALLVAAMLAASIPALADGQPPEPPAFSENGDMPAPPEGMNPPDLPEGMETPPEGMGTPPEGMGTPPEGGMGGPGGMPGGGSSQPESYDAVVTVTDAQTVSGEEITSTGTDENAVLVDGGQLTLTDTAVLRSSGDSTGGDSASFYGVGAAILAVSGTAEISNASISTDSNGGAGVFSYGDAVVTVSDSTIVTYQGASGGIHVAGGGTLYANNLDVTTYGGSSAAIRSDRGSGTMVVNGGSYVSNGSGSPAVYVTADITVSDAVLTATGSEALCLEGLNSVRLYDCDLSGNMPDDSQNDNTWTVILYQSMSGDAEVGEGRFEMAGGSLTSGNGGLFYTTNTDSEFVVSDVEINAEEGAYFLRVTGNTNRRGWGSQNSNGANCVFTAIAQEMNGDVQWDSSSTLSLYVTEGSTLCGAVVQDESCLTESGEGWAVVYIDEDSEWIVTGDSVLTGLHCAGKLVDESGNTVSVVAPDGTVLSEGTSAYTIVADSCDTVCDLSGAGALTGK